MTDSVSTEKSVIGSLRLFLGISGVIALLAGIAMLIWPDKVAVTLTAILGGYLIVAGVVYIGLGIFGSGKGGWARVGYIALGLLYIVAGIVAFSNLQAAALTFAVVTVIFVGVSWIFDGIVSLSLLGSDASRTWTLLYSILSILAGIAVIAMGIAAVPFFWVLLAISLIVIGILQIVRAITTGKRA